MQNYVKRLVFLYCLETCFYWFEIARVIIFQINYSNENRSVFWAPRK